jgi:acetylornithine deacetylase/succinyl-diaminopimelate desuccinylase-like protein
MDKRALQTFTNALWEDAIVPALTEYIKIPNKSPAFDPEWEAHGFMRDAVALMERWAREQIAPLAGAALEVVRLPGRTPVILIEVPGTTDDTVLLYGHLDKQPEMVGWEDGFGPWAPRRVNDRLYGRGGADDGYAMFAAIAALRALAEQKLPHARAVILIEACEESGSPDLPFYVDHLAARIGDPSLVICLDSGCGDYERLWLTTSLRGIAMGNLTVRVLDEGVHSGDASGIVPSSFRVLRGLLSRLEDEKTGAIKPEEFYVQIPPERMQQVKDVASVLGNAVHDKFPFAGGTEPMSSDLGELILNRTWRQQLAVTGIEGLPLPVNGGNVLLPVTTAKLSLRLPPTLDAAKATALLKKTVEDNPPYHASIRFDAEGGQSGWDAPKTAQWLAQSAARASQSMFGNAPAYMGEGGSIPFMAMLGAKFPKTQFVVTGVLGPHSNAHGPNEFLHIPMAKKLTAAIALILADHAGT